jgi:hypothetical protein
MSSVHLFLVNLSSLKLTSINYEVALEIVQYYGLIGKKTDDVICLFLPLDVAVWKFWDYPSSRYHLVFWRQSIELIVLSLFTITSHI